MLVFELEMIGIAVINQFCQTTSEANAIHNHVDSGSTDLVNILKEKKVMSFLVVIFLRIYPQTMCICYLVSDLKVTKLSCGCSFFRMYKSSLLGLLSHPIF